MLVALPEHRITPLVHHLAADNPETTLRVTRMMQYIKTADQEQYVETADAPRKKHTTTPRQR